MLAQGDGAGSVHGHTCSDGTKKVVHRNWTPVAICVFNCAWVGASTVTAHHDQLLDRWWSGR
jgi:hypothetical protein